MHCSSPSMQVSEQHLHKSITRNFRSVNHEIFQRKRLLFYSGYESILVHSASEWNNSTQVLYSIKIAPGHSARNDSYRAICLSCETTVGGCISHWTILRVRLVFVLILFPVWVWVSFIPFADCLSSTEIFFPGLDLDLIYYLRFRRNSNAGPAAVWASNVG